MALMTRSEFLAVLPPTVQPNNLRQRTFRGETMLSGRATSREKDFDWLDTVAIRVTEALVGRISVKGAAQLTDQTWPQWSDAVAVSETYPAGERPLDEHICLVIGELGDGNYASRIGTIAAEVKELPTTTKVVHAISLDRLLADLRRDATAAGVPLPDKFAPTFGSPEYFEWRRGIDDDETRTKAISAMIQTRISPNIIIEGLRSELTALRRQLDEERRQLDEMMRAAKGD